MNVSPIKPVTAAEVAQMRQRKQEAAAKDAAGEKWMAKKLKAAGLSFRRNAAWMSYLFDFWNADLGCAIQVDGPGDDTEDARRIDCYLLIRSALEIIRVPEFDEAAAAAAITAIDKLAPLECRRESPVYQMVLAAGWKERRQIIAQEMTRFGYPPKEQAITARQS